MTNSYIFDAGHGGIDPGCSGFGLVEKELTLEASLYLHKRVLQHGLLAHLTRGNDVSLKDSSADPNRPRYTRVKSSGATICISSHFNAASPTATGTETLHSIYSNGKLSNLIVNSIVSQSRGTLRNRGAKTKKSGNGDYYYMHRLTGSVETIIVEYGFLTNQQDAKYLSSQLNRHILYEGVIRAICTYEGIKYIPPNESPTYTTTPNTTSPVNTQQSTQTLYRVVAGSFQNRDNANARVDYLKQNSISAFLEPYPVDGKSGFRVIAGSYKDRNNALATQQTVSRLGIGCFVEVKQ